MSFYFVALYVARWYVNNLRLNCLLEPLMIVDLISFLPIFLSGPISGAFLRVLRILRISRLLQASKDAEACPSCTPRSFTPYPLHTLLLVPVPPPSPIRNHVTGAFPPSHPVSPHCFDIRPSHGVDDVRSYPSSHVVS